MVSRVNGNIQETRNEVESQKPTVPQLLIGMPIPQEHEVYRHKTGDNQF